MLFADVPFMAGTFVSTEGQVNLEVDLRDYAL